MNAIIPNVRSRSRPYAWGCIAVNPNPPRVGELTRIVFPLLNPGPDDLVIERIDVRVSHFGIGVHWDELPAIGPFVMPPDPKRIVEAMAEWMPTESGHRCVRAAIHVAGSSELFEVGRNLDVLEAGADERLWSVPFRLGNPERARAPLRLHIGGNNLAAIEAAVRIGGAVVPLDQPVWLDAGEEVHAELLLRARLDSALNHVRTLEATIHGRLIDGIHVTVLRPAALGDAPAQDSDAAAEAVREPAGAFAR
ncbi:MAG: hypothetical protein ACHQ4H_03065 [Ktedonobacterales bacterium]